jgi:hypothetical protein
MFDYVIFCLRTCWSRTLFLIFPQKLKRLKQERVELAEEIKSFIDKHVSDVDPENYLTKEEEIEKEKEQQRLEQKNSERKLNNEKIDNPNSDDLVYLEKRYKNIATSKTLLEELKCIESLSN